MKKSSIVWLVVIIVIIIGIFVWMNNSGSSTTAVNSSTNSSTNAAGQNSAGGANPPVTTTTTTTFTPAQGPVVLGSSQDAKLGNYIIDSQGMTLYRYTKDTPGVSNCTGACATSWPPYIVASSTQLVGGTGITGAISSIVRADGTTQVTYDGSPLYYWHGDMKAGDILGQGIGGVWFVINP